MYLLNLFNLKFSAIRNIISLLCCLFLFACSSTERMSEGYFSENGYARGFVNTNFSNNRFIAMSKDTAKKQLPSDHQLMLSLLHRPMTTDQAMMLAFAQERASYGDSFSNYGVEIKGDKASDGSNNRAHNAYSRLISQDINAVSIGAPR